VNIQSVQVSAVLAANIVPADPLASGSYPVGFNKKAHDLSAVTQLYSLKVTNLTAAATLDLDAGTITGGGTPNIGGGSGKDADGETIDLNFVHALQIRNTVSEELTVEITGWTGGSAPFDVITIPANGEVIFVLPSGEPLTQGTMVFTPATTGGLEFLILGKN